MGRQYKSDNAIATAQKNTLLQFAQANAETKNCKRLWASLKNDNNTADRHENRPIYFTTVLDCLTNC